MRYRYWQDSDGVRIYYAEKDPCRALAVAAKADRMISEGAPVTDVFALLRQNDDITPAIFARMVRFARIFHVDFWDKSRGNDPVYLFSRLREVPFDVQYAANHGRRMQVHRFLKSLEEALCLDHPSAHALRHHLARQPFLISRIFQEDVFLRVDDRYREAMLGNLGRIPFASCLAFVAQVVFSRRIPWPWRLRCFMMGSVSTWGRPQGHLRSRTPYVRGALLEQPQGIAVTIPGLTCPYYPEHVSLMEPYYDDSLLGRNPSHGFYMLAVNSQVQMAFAGHPLVRELHALSELSEEGSMQMWLPGLGDCGVGSDSDAVGEPPLLFDLMTGAIAVQLLFHLIRGGRRQQLLDQVRKRPWEVEAVIPLEKLVCLVSALGDWSFAERLVRTVERLRPGTVARAADAFGNTPLVYTCLANSNVTSWRPWRRFLLDEKPKSGGSVARGRYEACLAGLGCDPQRRNIFGVACVDARRYGAAMWTAFSPEAC